MDTPVQNKSLIYTFDELKEDVYCVTFNPTGDLLASASYRSIALWDICSNKLVHRINEDICHTVSFSPDGELLASGGSNLKLWNANTFELVETLKEKKENQNLIISLKFSPNSEVLASGDYTVSLWDVATGVLLQTFNGLEQSDSVYSIAYSKDGENIFAGCNDSKIKIWCKLCNKRK